MIEVTILDYLKTKLSVPVVMEKTTDKEFVLLEKTGSGRNDYINNSTFAIQSYSDSLYKAALLNEKVKEAMEDIIALNEVCSCELNTDYNFTDTQTKQYRYQAVFDIVHY